MTPSGGRVRARAPVRLDFAGGWTDVPPFSEREGGVVVNAAIALHAQAEVVPGGEGIRLVSEDLGLEERLEGAPDLAGDGRLPLLRAGLRLLPVIPGTITTRSEAPPGSGLGSSGALDVAVVAALAQARGQHLGPDETARLAWRLEVEEAGIAGGRQDQWAAAWGGIQRLEFRGTEVIRTPLELDAGFAEELAGRTVLCYTGHSRLSGAMISRVMRAYEQGERRVTGSLRAMLDSAHGMDEALRSADLAGVGRFLAGNWSLQCALDPGMRTDAMARLEQAVTEAGILGGKAAGAGAGGCMFFLARGSREPLEAAARAAGATILPVAWDLEGVRSC